MVRCVGSSHFRAMTVWRVSRCVMAVGLIGLLSSPALALIVADQAGTTIAPANDPGWDNVTTSGRNFVYLGDGWALSAFHVGPTDTLTRPGMSPQSLTFSTGTYQIIPGQNYTVRNPAGSQIANKSEFADLRLVRLNADPGLPSINIASSQVLESTPNREVVIIGTGPTREDDLTHWNATVVNGDGNDVWTEACGPCAHSGYRADNPNVETKRWGTNKLTDEDALFNSNDNDLRGIVEFQSGAGPRHVMSLLTKFDAPGHPNALLNETQAVSGDSGSAVFHNRDGDWELLGIVNFAFAPFVNGIGLPIYDRLPNSLSAVHGGFTGIADLSFYHQSNPNLDYDGSISDIIRTHSNYSIVGDINLDGLVSGDGTGPTASDDVTAFIEGWDPLVHQPSDIERWKQGDLNRDGYIDVHDFIELRTALQQAGASAGLAALDSFGSSFAVPEPTSLSLALLTAGLLAASARRRHRRAA